MTIKKGRGDTVAASLWKASAWAQGAYAAQAIGLTKTELRRLRTSAAKAIDGGEKVRCATTLFAIRDKLATDPAVKQPVDQVHQWIKAWCEDSQLRDLTMRAWPIVHERLLAAPVHQRWRHCKGPIAAIQTTLLNLGWDIPRADWWCDRTGQVWQAPLHDLKLVKHDHALFLKAVAAAAEAGLWKEATSFRRGAGLEAGCYYQHAASLYRRLLKKGDPSRPEPSLPSPRRPPGRWRSARPLASATRPPAVAAATTRSPGSTRPGHASPTSPWTPSSASST